MTAAAAERPEFFKQNLPACRQVVPPVAASQASRDASAVYRASTRRGASQMRSGGPRPPPYLALVYVIADSQLAAHQVRGLASTTCESGGVAGLRAAAAAGFCAGAAGARAIGWLPSGMYLRPPLSARS